MRCAVAASVCLLVFYLQRLKLVLLFDDLRIFRQSFTNEALLCFCNSISRSNHSARDLGCGTRTFSQSMFSLFANRAFLVE